MLVFSILSLKKIEKIDEPLIYKHFSYGLFTAKTEDPLRS